MFFTIPIIEEQHARTGLCSIHTYVQCFQVKIYAAIERAENMCADNLEIY